MLKKLISMSLTCAMVLMSASAIFGISASAATELTPPVFDRTQNASTYQTKILDEDFTDYTEETAFTSSEMDIVLDNKSTGKVGTVTVKKDSDNNKYIRITSKQDADWNVRLMKSFTATGNSILFGFDYRSASATLAYYSSSLAVNGEIRSNGTSLRHKANDVSMAQVGGTITTTENGADRWVKVQMLIVPGNQIVHFWVDGEYHGSSAFRKSAATLNQLWIGCNGTDKSIDIDNMSIINMGTTDDTWYKFDEVEKLTFDAGTDVPFTEQNKTGTGSITSDGKFKMTSTSNTNGDTKHYVYNLGEGKTLKDYAKISFDWYVKDAEAGSAPVMHMYVNGTTPAGRTGQIGTTVSFYEYKVSAIKVNDGTSNGDVKTGLTEGRHTFDMLLDLKEYRIYYVVDGTVSSVFPFRNNLNEVTTVFFRIYATSEDDEAQIDNLTFYKDGTKYFAPTLTSTAVTIDNINQTISMTEGVADSYTNMDDIADDIFSDKTCTIEANDKDGNGYFSDGDTVVATLTDTGVSYTYTVDVITNLETSMEALIVKGSDGQGDDFAHLDTVTKAGSAELEIRIKNNMATAITPAVVAAAYDDSGKMISIDVVDDFTIASGATSDIELKATVPSNLSAGKLKVLVWENLASQTPLMKPVEYPLDTNDFTVPTVISNNMVLQRNSTAYIFGKAPQGATVTATLSGGASASYTVPTGSNEFFAGLELGEYNTTEQTLTISAVDANGVDMGTETRTGVLIGDVYYGGGQSNMTRTFSGTANEIGQGKSNVYTAEEKDEFIADYEALGDSLSNVRFFASTAAENWNSRYDYTDAELAAKETWKKVDSSNIGGTYEVMVRMAGDIQKLSGENSDVPIGILCCAQGGTKLAKWVSRDTLFSDAFDQADKNEYESNLTNTSDSTRWASHTDLYYAGVRSVMPYGIKAAVWYQGESDSSLNYDKYLKAMIDEFRAGMRKDMPYLVVQLPGYVSGSWTEGTNPTGDAWAKKRLIQWNAQEQLSNVYIVVTNDTGDNGNIHPANKVDVADRLARTVLAKVMGEDIPYTGPTFNSVTYGTGTAAVKVNLNGGTLKKYETTEGTSLFYLYDGSNWTLADSITVSGDTITVGSSEITGTVTGVRYAYGPEIIKCIYGEFADGAKLPLAPFDTTYVFNTLN